LRERFNGLRFIDEHDGDAVVDPVAEETGVAPQRGWLGDKRSLALRTDEDFEEIGGKLGHARSIAAGLAPPGRYAAAPNRQRDAHSVSQPSIAVVIPTRDRPRLLRRCLCGLVAQATPPDEVVVVDDGSGAETAEVLATFVSQLPLRCLRQDPSRGPARARNAGWRHSAAELIAFTDDDCRPHEQWISELLAAAEGRRVLVGRTAPDPLDGEERSVFDRSMTVEVEDGRFSTCNVLYPRVLLDELGGFDASIVHAYGEDTDLGQRALVAGASAAFAADALVYHAVLRPGLVGALRERRRFIEMARLVRRHPRLRREVFDGVFLRPAHRRMTWAILGALLLPVTPAGIPAAGRWAADAVNRVPVAARGRRRLPGQLLALALLDAVEMAACLRGSIRHRTLIV
jgi:glycosyltransferase involved in cell wall biosynthesis